MNQIFKQVHKEVNEKRHNHDSRAGISKQMVHPYISYIITIEYSNNECCKAG